MIMSKKLIILTLALLPLLSLAQNQPTTPAGGSEQQTPTPQNSYQLEKQTVPYKVKHKVARQRRVATRGGNKALDKKNNSAALEKYNTALKADSNYAKAQYNAALANGRLSKTDEALTLYKTLCENKSATQQQREKAHYNAGNIYLNRALAARDTGGYDDQSLRSAIEQYKAALRLNSKNKDAQHNLSLAKQLLRKNQNQGNGGGGNNDQQNKDQQNKDQNQNQNQNNNQNQNQNQNQNKDQNKDQNQQQQQQNKQQDKKQDKQSEQRRREAERMLNAMKNNEQQTMKAVRAKENKNQGNPSHIDKNW